MESVWKYLEKNAQCEVFPELTGLRLEKEIQALASARELAFQKDALSMLAVLSGGDLQWVEKEMEKLEAYCGVQVPSPQPSPPKGGEGASQKSPLPAGEGQGEGYTITPAQVKLLCVAEGEANIFEFLDALGNKDRKTLLRTAEEQLREEDAFHIISRATGQIRALLAIVLAGQDGAKALKLHPFVAKKATAQARKWKAEELKKTLFALLALEYKAKTGQGADLKTQFTALLTQV